MTEVKKSTNDTNGTHCEQLIDISLLGNPSDLGAIIPILKSLNAGLPSLTTGNDEARLDLLQSAYRLVLSLESPRETMLRHCWAQVCHSSLSLSFLLLFLFCGQI